MQVRSLTDATGDRLVIEWDGDLDLHTIVPVRTAIHRAIDDGWTDLTIDLRRCGVVDSAGLGVLVGARRRTAEVGGRCSLLVTPRIERLLEVADLSRLFIIEVSVADGALDG